MDQLTVAGRLGQDAEMQVMGDGTLLLKFSVAVSKRERVDGDWQQTTAWRRCAMWGKRGEKLCQYLLKGTPVSVTGEMSVRQYEGRNGPGVSVEIRVDNVTLLGSKSDREQQSRQEPPSTSPSQAPASQWSDSDDIPF